MIHQAVINFAILYKNSTMKKGKTPIQPMNEPALPDFIKKSRHTTAVDEEVVNFTKEFWAKKS